MLGACSGTADGDRAGFAANGGMLNAGSGTGSGSSPGSGGSASSAAGTSMGFAGTSANNGGSGSVGQGGTPATGGAPGSGGSTGASCAGLTAWASGTTASDVSHNGKHYTCKVAGWCASTAAAYEPGVGYAWMDAWTDDGACGNGGGGGAPGGGGATGIAGSTGSSGSGGAPNTGCALDSVLGENNFNSWFPKRNGFYTYANLCKAIAKYPPFATTGDDTAKKREVAGFFANVARETGMLMYIDQISKDPATGNYWGRGPLQITWDYNYKACGTAVGADLLGNPNLVSTDGAITWETGLWFWMTNDGGTGKTPHQAIVAGNFGGTINAINGGIECHGPNEGANERIAHYQTFCQALGVDPGSMLTCW